MKNPSYFPQSVCGLYYDKPGYEPYMWSIEKGKEQSVNEKARFEITKKKLDRFGLSVDKSGDYGPSAVRPCPVFYSLKSRNVTMANYKSGFLLEDI